MRKQEEESGRDGLVGCFELLHRLAHTCALTFSLSLSLTHTHTHTHTRAQNRVALDSLIEDEETEQAPSGNDAAIPAIAATAAVSIVAAGAAAAAAAIVAGEQVGKGMPQVSRT